MKKRKLIIDLREGNMVFLVNMILMSNDRTRNVTLIYIFDLGGYYLIFVVIYWGENILYCENWRQKHNLHI